MKKYNILVMYPGMQPLEYELMGEITYSSAGNYQITEEDGTRFFFPIQFTIIEESAI